jgi:K+-dependent Na+/Ca+ exchanger-like protein
MVAAAIWGVFEVHRFFKAPAQVQPSEGVSSGDAASRKLLSSGAELIPGFTGAKCGSNWYYETKDPLTNKKITAKIAKDGKAPAAGTKIEDWGWSEFSATNKASLKATAKANGYDWTDVGAYAQWEADSGGIVYVILSIYLFLGIAIICDEQFTSALEMICSRFGLDLSPDVAGATFMAAGSSAPELATQFLAVFVAKSAVGLGTILGSAVFNILIIIGATAILVGEPLDLDFRPVIRDNFFYAVSVVLLCVLLAVDDKAQFADTIILLIWYALYILFMAFNPQIMDYLAPQEEDSVAGAPGDDETPLTPTMGTVQAGEGEVIAEQPPAEPEASSVQEETKPEGEGAPSEPAEPKGMGSGAGKGRGPEDAPKEDPPADAAPADVELQENKALEGQEGAEGEEKKHTRSSSYSTKTWHVPRDGAEEKADDGEEEEEVGPCMSVVYKILEVLSWPYVMIFRYTMPDCSMEEDDREEPDEEWAQALAVRDEAKKSGDADALATAEADLKALFDKQYGELECGQKWFWATFFISLLHITWLSFFMVEFMLKIGCLWGIPDVVMGLTFLAMGTSIPDALGSISVAQDGEGDMAVSNAVGSNVFDICIGLGLPWFIDLLIKTASGETCNYVYICNAGADVLPSIIILLSVIVVLFSVFVIGKWTLYPQSGYVLFATYFLFIIYQLLNTYVFNKDAKICTSKDDICA